MTVRQTWRSVWHVDVCMRRWIFTFLHRWHNRCNDASMAHTNTPFYWKLHETTKSSHLNLQFVAIDLIIQCFKVIYLCLHKFVIFVYCLQMLKSLVRRSIISNISHFISSWNDSPASAAVSLCIWCFLCGLTRQFRCSVRNLSSDSTARIAWPRPLVWR